MKQELKELEEKKYLKLLYNQKILNSLKVNILFFCINSKNDVWEYDYIHNDLLGNNYIVNDYFNDNYKNINRQIDILVYFCRDQKNYPWGHIPSYGEILNCVKIIKPKIIIQLSDEFHYENLQIHNELAEYCKLFLRQYHHPNYEYNENTVIIPLGYTNSCKKFNYDKEYECSFFGQIKSDRRELIDSFLLNFSNFIIGTKVSKEYMCEVYAKSFFVPCGRGNSSLNCFRIYEASMNKALPVIVGNQEEIYDTFRYEKNPPWIFSDTWNNATKICKELLNDDKKIKERIYDNYNWWNKRIDEIKVKINQTLLVNF